ncbi:hypothetical protein C5D34_10770 [Rathayibacter sp. AY1B1]|uniref:hypothetical protein n=1 Tax=unclassified Rathayibacter TaxID=2609250 RepID=UPI000CE74B2B|nr:MULTISPECIES: hypothetical protein [unclassified Rathayibacter]PPI24014.1 hypothetical protein C5D08_04150 [Rathayibacter sp. AY1B6]PPI33537.1 hypothetical protein C5D34_10770 [Rathayibacter sp. AY1B1]
MTSDTTPAGQGPLSRRTVVAGATWSLPVIAAATATPAAAASTTQTLAFGPVPANSIACTATTAPITMTLTGGIVSGVPVRVSLPAGFRFRSGATGTYVTDGSGVATIPAGDVIVGPSAGTASAAAGSAQASTSLPVRQTGVLEYGRVPDPIQDNSGWVHTYSQGEDGNVSIKANGDVWQYTRADGWKKLGTGASTEPSAAGLASQSADGKYYAHWIKGGVLQYSTGLASVMNNSGFVRTYGQGADGNVSVKSNGDIYSFTLVNGNGKKAWAMIGTGASTEPSAAGLSKTAAGVVDVVWIKNGVVQLGKGAAATLPNNSQFLRVYGLGSRGAAAVKSNGELWQYDPGKNAWNQVGTGADTGPSTVGLTQQQNGDSFLHWIKNGVLRYSSGLASVEENSGFVHTYGFVADGAVAVKSNGDVWHYVLATRVWTKVGTGASTEPNTAGVTRKADGTLAAHWIKTTTACA